MQFKVVCCLKYLLQLCRKPRNKAFFFRHNPLALPYSPMGSLPSGQFQTTTELVRSLHCKWQSSQSISACLERGFPSPLIILVVFSFIMKKDFCPHDGFKLTWIYGFLVPWLPRFQIKKIQGRTLIGPVYTTCSLLPQSLWEEGSVVTGLIWVTCSLLRPEGWGTGLPNCQLLHHWVRVCLATWAHCGHQHGKL